MNFKIDWQHWRQLSLVKMTLQNSIQYKFCHQCWDFVSNELTFPMSNKILLDEISYGEVKTAAKAPIA
jgi:hypothetical protein